MHFEPFFLIGKAVCRRLQSHLQTAAYGLQTLKARPSAKNLFADGLAIYYVFY